MRTVKNSVDHSFLPFPTFIEYKKNLTELKTALHIKKSSIADVRKILDAYIKPSQKLSDDIIKMREE
ncbi:MAG TPA: hypothetical protein ACFYEF_01700 [Candidatus Wunengus sp. YC63]|uniref:hypothetical protein n=1 Tax=Candidatus Wunengus sp. YC63 TaxID=3367699 RepID=UPI004028B5FB